LYTYPLKDADEILLGHN